MTFHLLSAQIRLLIPISFPISKNFQDQEIEVTTVELFSSSFGNAISRNFNKSVFQKFSASVFRNSFDVNFRVDDNRLTDANVQNLQFIEIAIFELVTLR